MVGLLKALSPLSLISFFHSFVTFPPSNQQRAADYCYFLSPAFSNLIVHVARGEELTARPTGRRLLGGECTWWHVSYPPGVRFEEWANRFLIRPAEDTKNLRVEYSKLSLPKKPSVVIVHT